MIYYIDSLTGDDANSGESEKLARKSAQGLLPRAGDRVLFRRGSSYRTGIYSPDGEAGRPIYYGAYGEGEPPCFYGSVNCSDAAQWEEISPNVWRLTADIGTEACNLVFDSGRRGCTLVWKREELDAQGKWWGTRGENTEKPELLLYSAANPGVCYNDIEVCVYGQRRLLSGRKHVRFENLKLCCSGVHGYAETRPEDVQIIGCVFEYIGGCVWSGERRIRFGNGAEFWDGAQDCVVRDCVFREIYDSCVTTQGSRDMSVPERLLYENNTFENYGMAAYEIRDLIGRQIIFRGNNCSGAGCGFSMAGESVPRMSEIYPQPMGHHIFAWRIEHPTENGGIEIRDNVFCGRPTGCDTYLIISDEAKKQIIISGTRTKI